MRVMKKSNLVLFGIVFLCVISFQTNVNVEASPLFFNFLRKTFGGGQQQQNRGNNANTWSSGGQYQKVTKKKSVRILKILISTLIFQEKKFPWDIFGIFGYKNVIRPNRPWPPNNGRPPPRPTYGPPGPGRPTNRPPFRPPTTLRPPFTSWPPPNSCNCDWTQQGWSVSVSPVGGGSGAVSKPVENNVVIGQPTGVAQPPLTTSRPPAIITAAPTSRPTGLEGNTYRNFAPASRPVSRPAAGPAFNAQNLGGGTFNPAQQFVPASDLPSYFPRVPGSNNRGVQSLVRTLFYQKVFHSLHSGLFSKYLFHPETFRVTCVA